MSADGPSDRLYRYTSAFFAALAGADIRDIVISPGSRSTPLALCATARSEFRTHVILDERAAGFFALGMAKARRCVVPLICTSGSAAANYLPAIVEARLSGVSLLVLTADRPPELVGWGATQTIEQHGLYGNNVVWAANLPVPSEATAGHAIRMAHRAAAVADETPGPVHLNWPIREPLEPNGAVPTPPAVRWHHRAPATPPADRLIELAQRCPRGIIAAGPADLTPAECDALADLSSVTGWPILADPLSGLRTGSHVERGTIISTADHLFKAPGFTASVRPDVVVLVGGPLTSKAFGLWLAAESPAHVVVLRGGWRDPTFTMTEQLDYDIEAIRAAVEGLGAPKLTEWREHWRGAERAAVAAVDGTLADGPLYEPAIVRAVADALDEGSTLMAASSMPVRDVDMFLPASARRLRVLANRGANGIDGLVATAAGVAASEPPVLLLIGDLAVQHDIGGLFAAVRSGADLTIVVADNGGGGIFEFLPIAHADPPMPFDELFLTPHPIDWAALATAAGASFRSATDADELKDAVRGCTPLSGVHLIVVDVDRAANVAQHRDITAAVEAAVR